MDGEVNKPIGLACDHAGYVLKKIVAGYLSNKGHEILDLGTHSAKSVDYPDYAELLAKAVQKGNVKRGVLICGSGIGISIAANRYPELRAALICDGLSARLSREHNDANVIVFGGRVIAEDVALNCLEIFLNTEFEGGRHKSRVEKLNRK